MTYFVNLSQVNAQGMRHWEFEYQLTKAYWVPYCTVPTLCRQCWTASLATRAHYSTTTSITQSATMLGSATRQHVCAMRQVDIDAYTTCLYASGDHTRAPAPAAADGPAGPVHARAVTRQAHLLPGNG